MKSKLKSKPKSSRHSSLAQAHESSGKSNLTGCLDPLEKLLRQCIDDFILGNLAARVVSAGLKVLGIGFRPVIDHITFRTLSVETRAKEFIKLGYRYDAKLGVINYDHWWAKVYRKPGYPTLFIDQAFGGKRGKGSWIPGWVETFGDKALYHVAIQVDNIETAVFYLEKQGIPFAGKIIGDKGSDLRQVFTQPEIKNGMVFSVLELTERHRGNAGFFPPQADNLISFSRLHIKR